MVVIKVCDASLVPGLPYAFYAYLLLIVHKSMPVTASASFISSQSDPHSIPGVDLLRESPTPTSQAIFLVLRQILIQNDHQGCELLYVHGTKSSDVPSHYDFNTLELSRDSSGQRTLALHATNVTYPRHEDIHRHTPTHCAVALFFFNDFSSPGILQQWLFDTIIPRYGPVIRKDEDHFIFLTPTESVADTALLSPKFGEKIKYKLALYQDAPKQDLDEVACKTIDFYSGNDGGPVPKILQNFQPKNWKEDDHSLNLFPDMTRDFNGHLFRITVPNVKYRFEMVWRDGAFHPKRGFYKWWLHEAIRKFNFTYFMFWSSFEKATGKPLKNGTWVGAAGDLLYDRADIAVIVGQTYSRHPFFGFSAVLSYEWFFFMTHSPRNTYSPNAIFWPFSPLLWALFFISLILMTFSLKAITEFSLDPIAKKSKNWTYSRMFDYIFSTFLEQDRDGPLSTNSIRMLCSFWLMFAMVLSNAYRGSLVTLIAFPVHSWVPTTFAELAHSSFKVVLNNVGKVGAAYDVLSSSTNPVFMRLYEKLEMIGQPELCLMKAMNEDCGCIIWEGITVYANARNLSDRYGFVPMVQSKDIGLFIADGFTYERRAIFKHHMDRTIDAAFQMGLTIKWLDLDKEFIRKERIEWERATNKTPVHYHRYEGPQKLVLSQFSGLYLLCLGGIVLASSQFFVEFCLRREGFCARGGTRAAGVEHERNEDETNNNNNNVLSKNKNNDNIVTDFIRVDVAEDVNLKKDEVEAFKKEKEYDMVEIP